MEPDAFFPITIPFNRSEKLSSLHWTLIISRKTWKEKFQRKATAQGKMGEMGRYITSHLDLGLLLLLWLLIWSILEHTDLTEKKKKNIYSCVTHLFMEYPLVLSFIVHGTEASFFNITGIILQYHTELLLCEALLTFMQRWKLGPLCPSTPGVSPFLSWSCVL